MFIITPSYRVSVQGLNLAREAYYYYYYFVVIIIMLLLFPAVDAAH
jgi:hypothetical protein